MANSTDLSVHSDRHVARTPLSCVDFFMAIGAGKAEHRRPEHLVVYIVLGLICFIEGTHVSVARNAFRGVGFNKITVALTVFVAQFACLRVPDFGGCVQRLEGLGVVFGTVERISGLEVGDFCELWDSN